ncbi:GroES-like protein, partial [Agrocybe pediades]
MPIKQTALILKDYSEGYVLEDIDIPDPGPGDLLVKIQAAALNPADWKVPKWKLALPLPAILGSDIAGDVEKVGDGVQDFKVGDRVFCPAENWKDRGGYQKYVLIKADVIAKIPDRVSYDEASTLPLAIATACSGLYTEIPHGIGLIPPTREEGYGKYSGIPIVVLGGASAVGQSVIQFAKLSGFAPIITTASLTNEEPLKRMGATHVVDRQLSPSETVSAITTIAGKPILHVYDVICSEATQQLAMDVIADGGRAAFPTPFLTAKSSKKVEIAQVFGAARSPHNYDLFKELYQGKVYEWLQKGLIVPNRFEVIPGGLKGVEEGLKRLEADDISRLKLVVHPQDTA